MAKNWREVGPNNRTGVWLTDARGGSGLFVAAGIVVMAIVCLPVLRDFVSLTYVAGLLTGILLLAWRRFHPRRTGRDWLPHGTAPGRPSNASASPGSPTDR